MKIKYLLLVTPIALPLTKPAPPAIAGDSAAPKHANTITDLIINYLTKQIK